MRPSFLGVEVVGPHTTPVGRGVILCLGAENVEQCDIHAGMGRDQFSWYRGHGNHALCAKGEFGFPGVEAVEP